jgi:urease accessory protein
MLELTRRIAHGDASVTLTLPLDRRICSRLRVTLDDGTAAGVFLERGQVLRDGDLLGTVDGLVVRVRAASEPLSEVRCPDRLMMARACYHLGNRHVPLQIADGLLRYQHDHVLDDMLRGLGLQPGLVQAPFEPEAGAYGGSAQAHPHRHDKDHNHHHGHAGHAHDDHAG